MRAPLEQMSPVASDVNMQLLEYQYRTQVFFDRYKQRTHVTHYYDERAETLQWTQVRALVCAEQSRLRYGNINS